jgi:hypothetical protein
MVITSLAIIDQVILIGVPLKIAKIAVELSPATKIILLTWLSTSTTFYTITSLTTKAT